MKPADGPNPEPPCTSARGTARASLLAALGLSLMTTPLDSAERHLRWQQFPALPDPIGFAGAFAGTSGGALLVAGGANFPDKMPWEGGRKVWYDTGFVLERPDGVWRSAFKLPRPLGYGVSVTTRAGVVCIGGSDATQHVRDVFRLSWNRGQLRCEPLPSLPHPLANACGALVGHTIYVAGGTATPDATNALSNFWALDLGHPEAGWRELPTWPGPARMLAVAAAARGAFYLLGGTALAPDADGKPVRTYLKDTYRFTPRRGWERVADLPHPVAAAPSPSPVTPGGEILVIGGDDGRLVHFEPKSAHPGFPKRVLIYNPRRDAWGELPDAPVARVTLPVAEWRGWFVLVSGESRPGVRSPEVWGARSRQR